MEGTIYSNVSNLSFDKLIDLVTKDYYDEYGEYRIQEIFTKLEKSNRIQEYIDSRTCTSSPNAKEIISLLNTIPFFIFSRQQSKCVAALHILLMWENRYNHGEDALNNIELMSISSEIIQTTLKGKILLEKLLNQVFFKQLTEA